MPELSFSITGAAAVPQAVVPAMSFRLRVRDASGAVVHAMLLRVQIRIQPRRRKYSAIEQERLADLFGEPERWSETARPLFWTSLSLVAPAFGTELETELVVPCTYDLEVASAKYFDALDEGEITLEFLFSGTVFVKTENGFRVEQIPWEKEAGFRLPVRTWKELMDGVFPECGWIRLRRSTLDALRRVKTKEALLTWDDVVESLVKEPVA
jgi:hypothetical protein